MYKTWAYWFKSTVFHFLLICSCADVSIWNDQCLWLKQWKGHIHHLCTFVTRSCDYNTHKGSKNCLYMLPVLKYYNYSLWCQSHIHWKDVTLGENGRMWDISLCKQCGFAVTEYCPSYSFVVLHYIGSKENHYNTNVKPYLCVAICICKFATKASLLRKIVSLLTIVKMT